MHDVVRKHWFFEMPFPFENDIEFAKTGSGHIDIDMRNMFDSKRRRFPQVIKPWADSSVLEIGREQLEALLQGAGADDGAAAGGQARL